MRTPYSCCCHWLYAVVVVVLYRPLVGCGWRDEAIAGRDGRAGETATEASRIAIVHGIGVGGEGGGGQGNGKRRRRRRRRLSTRPANTLVVPFAAPAPVVLVLLLLLLCKFYSAPPDQKPSSWVSTRQCRSSRPRQRIGRQRAEKTREKRTPLLAGTPLLLDAHRASSAARAPSLADRWSPRLQAPSMR